MAPDIRSFTNGSGGFGQTALNAARAAGLSDAQIRQQVAAAGLTMGPAAASSLGASSSASAPAPAPSAAPSGVSLSSFRSGDAAPGTIGLSGIQRARQAGLSDQQIHDLAKKEGLLFGNAAGANLAWDETVQKSYSDAGSGGSYQTRRLDNTAKGTVYAAGPMTDEQVRAFLAGRPASEWEMPASSAGAGEPYKAASGSYVSPTSVDLSKRINPSAYQQPAAAAVEQPPAQAYQQSFDSASASYQKTIDELNTKLKTAEADREAAANDARLYREEAIDTQLAGLRSGGSAGRSRIGSGTGALASGGGSYSASRSRSLVDVRAGLDATDSVLNRKTPVVTPLSSGRPANSAQASSRSAASGSSAAGYYSRRFG